MNPPRAGSARGDFVSGINREECEVRYEEEKKIFAPLARFAVCYRNSGVNDDQIRPSCYNDLSLLRGGV
jgi:hypothetical protein